MGLDAFAVQQLYTKLWEHKSADERNTVGSSVVANLLLALNLTAYQLLKRK